MNDPLPIMWISIHGDFPYLPQFHSCNKKTLGGTFLPRVDPNLHQFPPVLAGKSHENHPRKMLIESIEIIEIQCQKCHSLR